LILIIILNGTMDKDIDMDMNTVMSMGMDTMMDMNTGLNIWAWT
jgi:hypothetical protein